MSTILLTDEIQIFKASLSYFQVETYSHVKMQIQTDPVMQLYVSMPPNQFTDTVGKSSAYVFISKALIWESSIVIFNYLLMILNHKSFLLNLPFYISVKFQFAFYSNDNLVYYKTYS